MQFSTRKSYDEWVRKPAIAVVVGTLLALLVTVLFLPVRRTRQWRPALSAAAIARFEQDNFWCVDDQRQPADERVTRWQWERRLRLYRGERVPVGKSRFTTVWTRDPWVSDGPRYDKWVRQDIEVFSGDLIRWPIVLATQALILLLGGGLLTFVVRRERQRKAVSE